MAVLEIGVLFDGSVGEEQGADSVLLVGDGGH